jgi:hypothetical protein
MEWEAASEMRSGKAVSINGLPTCKLPPPVKLVK